MPVTDIEKRMHVYSKAADFTLLPDVYAVARLDGRGFSKLTKKTLELEKPYDPKFWEAMQTGVERVMNAGFNVVLAYTQSDETSLLFHPDEQAFSRRISKWCSLLASEMSVAFSMKMNHPAVFDGRLIGFPKLETALDYFAWRATDAHRNSLSSHAYWALVNSGQSPGEATRMLEKSTTAMQNELLFVHGINFNDLPVWKRRGIITYWEAETQQGIEQHTGNPAEFIRRRLVHNFNIPAGDAFREYIRAKVPVRSE